MAYRGGFGGGFGGGNQMQMMKQIQKMQQDLQKAQEELDEMEIEGTAGGGLVKVTMNAKKVISGITIDPKAVDPDDVEMLEDLIVAALNDGYNKADEEYADKMGAFGNLGL